MNQTPRRGYAEAWARRVGVSVWGHKEPRRFFSDAHWQQPRSWNAEAAAKKTRQRVFCASMADVFEERHDLDATRERLWSLIAETPNLDWQLLTKRPQAVTRLAPWGNEWPSNVWLKEPVALRESVAAQILIEGSKGRLAIRALKSRQSLDPVRC